MSESVEKDAPRLVARDGKPGCPVTVWDGPYRIRCSLGASVGRCAYHGAFDTATPSASTYRPCAGCDEIGESCRAIGCPATSSGSGAAQ